MNHVQKVGIEHPKVKYPVAFGQGDNKFFGIMATQDIPKGEIIIKVPAREIMNTKKAFYAPELQEIFYNHPEIFGKHNVDGEENMLYTFTLLEIDKKEKSHFHHMIKMWPRDADILMAWEEEDLAELQDPTLSSEA